MKIRELVPSKNMHQIFRIGRLEEYTDCKESVMEHHVMCPVSQPSLNKIIYSLGVGAGECSHKLFP